jgi:hypothetical protein
MECVKRSIALERPSRSPGASTATHFYTTTGIDQPNLPLPYVAYICFKCFRYILLLFHMDISKVYLEMLHMLQLFQRHVSNVYFKCFIGMFQQCFPDACCVCVYLHVAYVPHICCMCFIRMLRIVAMVFKCFNRLQMYIAIVVFGCFKSRSGVASLLSTFCYIVSMCPPLSAVRVSIRRRGRVLPN